MNLHCNLPLCSYIAPEPVLVKDMDIFDSAKDTCEPAQTDGIPILWL